MLRRRRPLRRETVGSGLHSLGSETILFGYETKLYTPLVMLSPPTLLALLRGEVRVLLFWEFFGRPPHDKRAGRERAIVEVARSQTQTSSAGLWLISCPCRQPSLPPFFSVHCHPLLGRLV